MGVDHDFNRFVDECRGNFVKFLKYGSKVKARPKVISRKNMGDFENYVEERFKRDFRVFKRPFHVSSGINYFCCDLI